MGEAVARVSSAGLGLLLRMKLRMFTNRFDQAAREQPVKLFATLVFLLMIWGGLYELFYRTLRFVKADSALEGIVAVPLVFQFFFIALAVMLAFSNAIISYGGLFGRDEAAYLLTAPVHPRAVVTLKFLESLFFASWSLILLGLPLMVAMAHVSATEWATGHAAGAEWPFYTFFICFFVFFVPIPAAAGLVAAWAVARYFPRSRLRVLALVGAVVVVVGSFFLYRATRETEAGSALWLKSFFSQMALIQNALLPNQWISEGITAAAEGRYGDAAFYLFVIAANAVFLSWLAVTWVAGRLAPAFARAHASGRRPLLGMQGAEVIARLAEAPFFYLPRPLRLLARKDVRCFLRDPIQWSQMVILLGLLALYVSNVGRLGGGVGSSDWVLLVSFLNLTAVSLILATFTSRFVFPLVSLEGHQFWLLGLLPLRRDRILWAKFAYATTVTLVAGLAVTLLSIRSLHMPPGLAAAQLVIVSAICVALCGAAIGLGAYWPMFDQRNPARIASGFGGTVNLIVSVLLVVITLTGTAIAGLSARTDGDELRWGRAAALLTGVVVFDLLAAGAAMTSGIRRFRAAEF